MSEDTLEQEMKSLHRRIKALTPDAIYRDKIRRALGPAYELILEAEQQGNGKAHEIDLSRFARAVIKRRLAHSLREAAAQIGISASTLSRIENHHMPDLDSYMRVCTWLGCSADEFRTAASGGGER